MNKWLRLSPIVVMLVIGVAVILIGQRFKSHPQLIEKTEFSTRAKFIAVPRLPIKISASGYGHVRAAQQWDAVAEVAGKVVYLSDKLKDGEFVSRGEELLRIDPSSYQLALSQIEAQIAMSNIKDQTTELSINTRRQELALLDKEFRRQQQLAKQGNVSRSSLDTAERNLLNARVGLQTLENSLQVNRAEREVLQVQLQQAELDLQRTHLIAPMDVRITEVQVSDSQYANRGQLLFRADGIAAAEVESRFAVGQLRPLVMSSMAAANELGPAADVWVPGVKGLPARIVIEQGEQQISWEGQVSRVSANINPQTQTIGVVTRVEQPYAQARSGLRPPLVSDLFVRVELHTRNHTDFTVIPASALHQGKVYVINDEQRLEIRAVKVDFQQQGYAVIGKGLRPKERIVTSDLVPALQGMLLEPVKDNPTMKQLLLDALGEIPDEFKQKLSAESAGTPQ